MAYVVEVHINRRIGVGIDYGHYELARNWL